ncbi:glycosyltransferase family 9 protein [Paracoccus ravus]|uniref:glycosyltransferase family 9 protein n=1 Tax=Paracoccus ravus TaxID=2447760 RepID=UPI00106EC690|nr:glycosyltransferase family 9 protein [Paracoccus ravus]
MNTPHSNKTPTSENAGFAGKLWIDTAQVTRIETAPDGTRKIRAGVISGWAIGPDPFVTIEVIIGNTRVARAKVGRYRPDIAQLYPDLPHAEYTGFEAVLTQGDLPEGPCQVILMAVSTSGKVFVKRHPLGGTDGGSESPNVSMRTHIEKCEIDAAGLLHVTGWAVAQTPIISIQLFGEGRKIAGTLPGLSRPDVGKMFPQYPHADRAGFFVATNLPERGRGTSGVITIEILARDGSLRRVVTTPQRVRQISTAPAPSAPIPSAAIAPPRPEPEKKPPASEDCWFFPDVVDVDTTGNCSISGWSAALAGLDSLTLHYGGAIIGQARLGLPRPDVARAYPNLPSGTNSGFSFDLNHAAGFPEGPASLVVTAALKDGTERLFEIAAVIVPPSARVSHYDDIVLGLDTFQLAAGHATKPVTGAFRLSGWAVARAGVSQIEVFLDGASLGLAYIGIRREELAEIFFDFPETLLSGFALSVPVRLLTNGRSEIRIVITDRNDKTLESRFTIDVTKDAGNDGLRQKMPFAEAMTGLDIMAARGPAPVCDILIRTDGKRDLSKRLLASLQSISRQVWPHWRVWLVPDGNGTKVLEALDDVTAAMPDQTARIDLIDALPALGGEGFVMVLNAGDRLAVDGLLEPLLAAEPGDQLLYGDDRRADVLTPGRVASYFKPAWSPDLLLSQNYLGRAWLASRALLSQSGMDPAAIARTGDYANVLRLTGTASSAIRHVPGLMLEATGRGESPAAERRALQSHLRAIGDVAKVRAGAAPFLHRLERQPIRRGKVSIIIPSIGAKDHILRCLDSIRAQTQDTEVEIVVVDNIRRRRITAEGRAWKKWFRTHADLVVEVDEPFNWSRLNNLGAAAATGDYLLFLNDDVEVLTPDWLTVMMAEAERPEVGVVGPQLLYPDGKVQHAGMFLSRTTPGSARHAFRFAAADDPCYFGLALSQRNVLCVTGACMMLRREVFEAVDGFDEAHSVVNNDIDFCLRLHRAGLAVIYTPHTNLIHYELASRANLKDNFDRSGFLETWGDLCLAGDPYLNPAISSDADDFAPEEEPIREVYAGHPLGSREGIKRILAVKLDHIGDLVTALPAFRRIKELFPHAHLTALVGRSAMGIAGMESAIDELIPFEFFDARSGLGRKKLSKTDYAALEADLTARRFDLAVDLRKMGDTRHILQHSGAPLTAGYDASLEFPWLDIALEWERDPLQTNKRNHVTTDLLNLVETLGTAFTPDRRTIATPHDHLPEISEALRTEFNELFANDYVVIHPAAGTPLRQWSTAFFARLIDLLADQDDMRIALIGGPDEREIASRVLDKVQRQDRVFNLVGRSKLSEVPRIMAESVLFVGNNSGPSHIASGLGVPTVAVHSALVSSEEWGPLGPSAVALRRDMTCGPCYIAMAEQCHRGMACLTSLTPFSVYRVCKRFMSLRRSVASQQDPKL